MRSSILGAIAAACCASPFVSAQQLGETPLLLADAASASEATTGPELAEVVVTAQRRAENLQNVPIAVSVLSGQALQSSGINNTMDLTSVTPGFTISANQSIMEPHIRGVGSTNNTAGNEQSVATYVDGVYIASPSAGLLDLADVKQVSVLKGPQGTLFGRNATGGVIMVTTKDPTQQFHADVRTSYDSYETARTALFFSGGIAKDLAASFAGSFVTQGKGWGTNFANNGDVRKVNKDITLRSKWLYTPTDAASFKLSVDYGDRLDSMGTYAPYPGAKLLMPGYEPSTNPWDADIYYTPQFRVWQGGSSLTADFDLGFAKLIDIAAYRKDGFTQNFDVTAAPTAGEVVLNSSGSREVTEELRLDSQRSDAFKWTTGVYYFNYKVSVDPLVIHFFPGYFSQIDANLGVPAVPVEDLQIFINSREKAESFAWYGQVTAEVLPRTHLTLGARYTEEKRSFYGAETGVIDAFPVGDLIPSADGHVSSSRPTWRIALDRDITKDSMAYVSFNTGFKSGGYNMYDPANPPYSPETIDAYELGYKSEWFQHRLRINTAAFYYEYKNIQVTHFVFGNQDLYNGAAARAKGVDLDFDAQVLAGFRVGGGMEWLHSVFTDFPNAIRATPNPSGLFDLTNDLNAEGKYLPFAPHVTADLRLDEQLPGPKSSSFDVNVTEYYNSGYFGEPDNVLRQPSFSLLNLGITWANEHDDFSVSVWAHNLLNRAVWSQLGTVATGRIVDATNPPRTYGFTIEYRP